MFVYYSSKGGERVVVVEHSAFRRSQRRRRFGLRCDNIVRELVDFRDDDDDEKDVGVEEE